MGDSFSVKIILPSEVILDAKADMVNIPGGAGMFGVLSGHAKIVSSINRGIISVFLAGKETKYFVYGGVAQVTGKELNILTEFAVNIASETKTGVMEKITNLQDGLSGEKEQLKVAALTRRLEKYQALLKFV